MEQNNSNTPVEPTKIFFGGAFNFDCRDEDYKIMAAEDYRAQILGSVDALIRPKDMNGMSINDNVLYIGPFYFEAESLKAEDIVACEKQMIERCTDAVFVLDDAACPGTIAEIMYANSLQKTIHLFYVQREGQALPVRRLAGCCQKSNRPSDLQFQLKAGLTTALLRLSIIDSKIKH